MKVNLNLISSRMIPYSVFSKTNQMTLPIYDALTFKGNDNDINQDTFERAEADKTTDENNATDVCEVENKADDNKNKDAQSYIVPALCFLNVAVLTLMMSSFASGLKGDVDNIKNSIESSDENLENKIAGVSRDVDNLQEDIENLESKVDKLIEMEDERKALEQEILSLVDDEEAKAELMQRLAAIEEKFQEYMQADEWFE